VDADRVIVLFVQVIFKFDGSILVTDVDFRNVDVLEESFDTEI